MYREALWGKRNKQLPRISVYTTVTKHSSSDPLGRNATLTDVPGSTPIDWHIDHVVSTLVASVSVTLSVC